MHQAALWGPAGGVREGCFANLPAAKAAKEAAMCHYLPVNLSAEDKKSVKRLTGVLIPAYAAVALAVIAAIVVVPAPRSGGLVASAALPAASR
jgi:hypothetical protein